MSLSSPSIARTATALSSTDHSLVPAPRDHATVLQDLLVCPHCRTALRWEAAERIACPGCERDFPLNDGIPQLAVLRSAARPNGAGRDPSAATYEHAYQVLDAAAQYNQAYEAHLLKRWSTRREWHLLRRLLGSQPRSRTLLDLPCGGGRLSPVIGEFTDLLIEADVGIGQLLYGRHYRVVPAPRVWISASAFHIPLRDASVDAVVCIRLCHHLPEAEERRKLLAEILRVAARFVVVTFFDHHSLKNVLRRIRRPFDHQPPKHTMTIAEVRQIAAQSGARLQTCPMLSPVGSGHRYALLVK